MIQNVATLPGDVALSSFGALLAPVLLVGACAVVLGLVGLVIGIVAEWRDGMARSRIATAASDPSPCVAVQRAA